MENRKKVKSRVGFSLLYGIFRSRVILHFSLIVTTMIFFSYLVWTNNKIFSEQGTPHSNGHGCSGNCSHGTYHTGVLPENKADDENTSHDHSTMENGEEYGKYLPFCNYWKKFHLFEIIRREQFIIITLLLLSLRSLFGYFSSLLEKQIATKSYFHLKSMLLKKLWKLDLEQKKLITHELRALLENEIGTVSELWEHLPTHFFQSIFTILVFGLERIIRLKDTGGSSLAFFCLSNLVFIITYSIAMNYATRKYEIYRRVAVEELAIVDKQISNAQLIENMGLVSFYEDLRDRQAEKTLLSEKRSDRSMSFLTTIVSSLPDYYRYLSLLFISKSLPLRIALSSIAPFFLVFDALKDIFDCFKDYSSYKIACSKLDSFLSIKEREENLEKESVVGLGIEEILLTNIDFKYSSSEQLVLKNYSRKFFKGSINRITGGNGTGKTTILYLILGIIKPLGGEVLIKFSSGRIMNLHKEINLCEWREKMAVYLSHDNLIENGSTGQKQLENILKAFDQRKSSQIFIFDESANALDSEKQGFVAERLRRMTDEGKIVILVQHKNDFS